jgi:hypothetical protein
MAKPSDPTAPPPNPAFPTPRIEVLQRRLQSPFGAPAVSITLREPGWEPRWFNAAIAADHIWRAKENGWMPVKPAELADPDQIGGFTTSPDGFVVRGEKGQELLMRLPTDWRKQIQAKKTEQNTRNMRPGAMKREVAEAAGKKLGDQAGQFVNDNVRVVGDVRDSIERVHRGSEVE